MNIRTSDEGSTFVVELDGRLNSPASSKLEKQVKIWLSADQKQILFDCELLSYISSAGLRVLLSGAKMVQRKGGTMALCNLSSNVQEVFEVSGFINIFNVYASRQEALTTMG